MPQTRSGIDPTLCPTSIDIVSCITESSQQYSPVDSGFDAPSNSSPKSRMNHFLADELSLCLSELDEQRTSELVHLQQRLAQMRKDQLNQQKILREEQAKQMAMLQAEEKRIMQNYLMSSANQNTLNSIHNLPISPSVLNGTPSMFTVVQSDTEFSMESTSFAKTPMDHSKIQSKSIQPLHSHSRIKAHSSSVNEQENKPPPPPPPPPPLNDNIEESVENVNTEDEVSSMVDEVPLDNDAAQGKPSSFDEVPVSGIAGQGKSFQQILDEKLIQEKKSGSTPTQSKPKVQSFLRRGEGLKRYYSPRTPPVKQEKSPPKSQNSTPYRAPSDCNKKSKGDSKKKTHTIEQRKNRGCPPKVEKAPEEKSSDHSKQSIQYNPIFESDSPTSLNKAISLDGANTNNGKFPQDTSFMMNLQQIDLLNQKEPAELELFEMLEQAADTTGCSNVSVLLRNIALQQQSHSTSAKTTNEQSNRNAVKYADTLDDTLQDDFSEINSASNIWNAQEPSCVRAASTIAPQVFTFDDEEPWTVEPTSQKPPLSSQTKYQSSDDADSIIAGNIEPVVASTPPIRKVATITRKWGDVVREENNVSLESKSSFSSSDSVMTDSLEHKVTSKPSLPTAEAASTSIVAEKIDALEKEISVFKMQNAALTDLREQKEKELKAFKAEIDSFEKKKAEELDKFEEYRNTEITKIRREKRLLEETSKRLKEFPTKREREEIESLKQKISKLESEMKHKETKATTTIVRLRTRIDAAERENKELKDEIRLLEKKRIDDMKKQATINATVPKPNPINAINRKISSKIVSNMVPQPPPPRSQNSSSSIKICSTEDESSISKSSKPLTPRTVTLASPIYLNKSNSNNSNKVVKFVENTSGEGEVEPKSLDSIANETIKSFNKENGEFGKVETKLPDGGTLITYTNGTKLELRANNQGALITYFNGDTKRILPDKREIYFYAEANITDIQSPDGLREVQFPNKQVEKHYPNGTKEIIFPDGTIKYLHADKKEETVFKDGTVVSIIADGTKTIQFPNGQREIHTKQHKKREFPDGTVKLVYPDGTQETRYPSGLIRIKDRYGKVISQ